MIDGAGKRDSQHFAMPELYPPDLAGQVTSHKSRLNLGVFRVYSVFNLWLPTSWVFAGSRGQDNQNATD